MKQILGLLLVGVMAAPAAAQITVDGTKDAAYGGAIAVQAVETNFGNANPPGSLGGSELDAAYAQIVGGRLYIMLTGNHEPNFNKLDIFIDSKAGGENTLTGIPQYDFFNGGNWISQNLSGLTFDAGFTADYHLFSRWGGGTSPYDVDFVDRQGGASASVPGSKGSSPNAVGLVVDAELGVRDQQQQRRWRRRRVGRCRPNGRRGGDHRHGILDRAGRPGKSGGRLDD